MWVFCPCICVYSKCMPGAHESQKRVLDAQELKSLYMVVSGHMGAGT